MNFTDQVKIGKAAFVGFWGTKGRKWKDQTETIQRAWIIAATAAVEKAAELNILPAPKGVSSLQEPTNPNPTTPR